MQKRKLIEVALPLEAINRESAHEKSVPRKGHPATLHLWWARRPVAAARALLFAQLVDDPSSHPSEFPTEAEQRAERERLHGIIERLAKWENTADRALMREAYAEIERSTGGEPPAILDPFAGGGTIPLEAQRLGLKAAASDLNPVAVLINRALIELPPQFHGQQPVFPGLAGSEIRDWEGPEGLAADVRAYGQWMRAEAVQRIGKHYPTVATPEGTRATVIAWLWARTVRCPNPACGIEMPLVRTWWLGKKKGREAYVVPEVVSDPTDRSGQRVRFSIGTGLVGAPAAGVDGTVSGRTGAVCVACQGHAPVDYLRTEGRAGRSGQQLMAVVAEGQRRRLYFAPDAEQVAGAVVDRPDQPVSGEMAKNPRWFSPPGYGLTGFADLFTDRQLLTLTTFSDLVGDARSLVIGHGGSAEYADAVATYLAFLGSKLADWLSSVCSWIPQIEGVRDTFARQAIPMTWDFVEINPLSTSVGNVSGHFEWIVSALESLPKHAFPGQATQADAAAREFDGYVIATDPPYYDNIGYSDLSDFFYV